MKKSRRKPRWRRLRQAGKPIGAAPGTLHVPEGTPPSKLAMTLIHGERLEQRELASTTELPGELPKGALLWLDVVGLDAALLEGLHERFELHRLALEDVASGHQRPKVELFEGHHFAVLRRFWLEQRQLHSEQVSLFFGKNYVISFREQDSACFAPVRERIQQGAGRGRFRQGDAAYLAYALLDTVVDEYFPLLELYGDRLDALEDAILEQVGPQLLVPLREVRRELGVLRRFLLPARDALGMLTREEARVPEIDRLYFRDSYDHAVQLLEVLEGQRELAVSLLPLYSSSVSNRAAEISRLLTMVATIFIPLSFVAGLYGMNFDQKHPYNMPELKWAYGYPAVLGVMAVMVVGLLVFFWRKGWIGSPAATRYDRRTAAEPLQPAATPEPPPPPSAESSPR